MTFGLYKLLELPKSLRDALRHFASAELIRSTQDHLTAVILQASEMAVCDDMPPLRLDNTVEPVPWKEGVEEYQSCDEGVLWTMLGLPSFKLPFFNDMQDPAGVHTPWTDAGKSFFTDTKEVKRKLSPRWHQLVGLLKLLVCSFDGLPVLLMDEVGLGKTMQAISLVTTLCYYRQYFSEHSSFPGIFSELALSSNEDSLPFTKFRGS